MHDAAPIRRSSPHLAPGLALAFLVFIAGAAHAAWPHNPNINLPVCKVALEQSAQVMVSDGSGGAIVAWQDFRNGITYHIYAQHILASGVVDPAWPANGLIITNAGGNQQSPAIVSDGSSGAIIAWHDSRSMNYDIYAQHVFASGSVDPMWPVDGRAVCAFTGDQQNPALISDGAGGAIIAWQDVRGGANSDIYAEHVFSLGSVDVAWPTNGARLCSAAGNQVSPKLCSDGAGGAVVVWTDYRAGGADLYAIKVLSSGALDASWPGDGRALCTISGDQINPVIESNGAGGALIAWEDYRNGALNTDIYITHVTAVGSLYWSSSGIVLCNAANIQANPAIIRDAANGVLIAWQDHRTSDTDIYVQHVMPGGVDASWPGGGLVLTTALGDQQAPTLTTDGAGGAIVAWWDLSTPGIFAQHVTSTGTVEGIWPVNGRSLTLSNFVGSTPRIASDGAGGAIAAWSDNRNGNSDIYAQRVARFGYLGTPEAEIASITDVPNDQGGKVKVSFNPSWLDTESDPNLSLYEIWRSVPGSIAEAAIRDGARQMAAFSERPPRTGRIFVAAPNGAQAYWEYLGSQSAAHYIPGYAYLAATAGDSTGAYNPATAFMVVARNASGSMYWLSAPKSGYSADNIAPVAPAPFTGQYASGSTHLHWDPNTESDLAGYRLYRGTSSGFVPGPGNRVAAQPDTGYVDAAGMPYYYKLSAVDIHGNESAFTTLSPSNVSGVEEGAADIAFARPFPNPTAESALLRWSLPRASAVSLEVFDASGRRVRALFEGLLSAGGHDLRWDLRNDTGTKVGNGLYFVRLSTNGRVLVERLATVR
jgi:hypothetical protein